MELSDLDPFPVRDENDDEEAEQEGGDNDSVMADDGGVDEDRVFDGASSYTSGTSDSDVYLLQAASEGNLVQVKRYINEIKKGEKFKLGFSPKIIVPPTPQHNMNSFSSNPLEFLVDFTLA